MGKVAVDAGRAGENSSAAVGGGVVDVDLHIRFTREEVAVVVDHQRSGRLKGKTVAVGAHPGGAGSRRIIAFVGAGGDFPRHPFVPR